LPMRERLEIPQGVVLLKESETPEGRFFENLSLNDVPEDKRDHVLGWLRFTAGQVKIHPTPLYASKYEVDGVEVKYRIISVTDPLNSSRFLPHQVDLEPQTK
jgi:hypothetical protein